MSWALVHQHLLSDRNKERVHAYPITFQKGDTDVVGGGAESFGLLHYVSLAVCCTVPWAACLATTASGVALEVLNELLCLLSYRAEVVPSNIPIVSLWLLLCQS